jgi:hypothetical protein
MRNILERICSKLSHIHEVRKGAVNEATLSTVNSEHSVTVASSTCELVTKVYEYKLLSFILYQCETWAHNLRYNIIQGILKV